MLAVLALALAPSVGNDVRACTARDLQPAGGMLQGATGSMVGFVRFRNVSTTRCRVGGRPRARIFDHGETLLPTRERPVRGRTIGVLPVREVSARGRLTLYLFWSEWCGAWPRRTFVRTLFLHVTLTTGVHLTAPFRSGRPRCDTRAGSTLGVTAFGLPRS